eukprot:gb/GEZN01008547.1/.p1 GENE.gb/GEZN01008547.1/~~gb/GEZN01008547.1/.p1  ORF type:complete len:268 (-),score=22.41 gb/GEZN01008547.1/:244-1047(-)
MIDEPIAIPSRSQRLVIAVRFGSMEAGRAFREKLLQDDIVHVREREFAWFTGWFPRTAKVQLSNLLEKMNQVTRMDSDSEVNYNSMDLEDDYYDDEQENVYPEESKEVMGSEEYQKIVTNLSDSWIGTSQEKQDLKAMLDTDWQLFQALQAGGVKDFIAKLNKIPGSTIGGTGKGARLSVREETIIGDITDDLWDKGLIEKSNSDIASPVRVVPKPDGTLRMCINYRRLNEILLSDKTQLPTLREGLNRLQGGNIQPHVTLSYVAFS